MTNRPDGGYYTRMAEPGLPILSADDVQATCQKAVAGNSDAIERLLWYYHDRLLEYARRKVGPDWHGKIDAEDILQEAYVDAFAGISKFEFRGGDSFYHWLTHVIERRFIDHVRRVRAAKRDVSREVRPPAATSYVSLMQQCFVDSTTPSRFLRQEEAISAMMTCLAGLPDDYREVVQRVHLRQEPIAAVAADLGRTEDAIRRLAGRALERLREGLLRASQFQSRAG
jgi:RNA polymerase sigma-70 factor (ECF subfamily)